MESNSKPEEKYVPEERSFKEDRIRSITFMYYSNPEIKKAIFEFSKNRECVPRYFEGFGKRPDSFQYESDILEQVRKGATSFHGSEELWSDPLEISTNLSKKEFDDLRIGWDLLMDIDSPYLEYSKRYTHLIINALKFHGIKNIGVKFSGSKGFHIIVPWKAFPKEIYNQKTKDMFPEWPRIICQYLTELIQPKLAEEILGDESLKQIAKKTGKKEEDLIIKECTSCHRPAIKKYLLTWICSQCKNEIVTLDGVYNNRRKSKCPECRKELIEKSRSEIYSCEFCNIDSRKNQEMFEQKERIATERLIEADLILVAPRHLFRMPYSLHEKTALSSIVINPDTVKDFQIKDAKPLKFEVKNFYPEVKEEEAKNLLLQALDWKEQKERKDKINKNNLNPTLNSNVPEQRKDSNSKYKKVSIPNPSEDIFPPCIKLVLKGITQDGRKRALFILINFFRSLGVSDQELEKRIYEWNEKNTQPLKTGYVQSQLIWFKRNQNMLPPNCDKPNYKDLNICHPDELCKLIKNPLNYATKKFFKKNM